MDGNSPEHELLLSCARVHLRPEDAERIVHLVRQEVDWNHLLLIASAHGMVPLLASHLSATCPDAVPQAALDELRATFTATAASNLAMAAELANIIRLFESHGIPAIPFKGPLVAAYVYGKLALRPFVDLDVVVPKRCVAAARELLLFQGYRSAAGLTSSQDSVVSDYASHYQLVRDGDAGFVELHWRFMPKHFGFSLDPEQALQRAERIELARTLVPTLSRDDLLLVLCMHGSKHVWAQLEWICSVAELLRMGGIDWDRVFGQAQRFGSRRTLFVGLCLARDLLAAPVPLEVSRSVDADSRACALAAWVSERLFSETRHAPSEAETSRLHHYYHLRTMERLRDKVRYVYHSVTVPTMAEWSTLQLPDALLPLYRVIRPLRLAGKYGYAAVRRPV